MTKIYYLKIRRCVYGGPESSATGTRRLSATLSSCPPVRRAACRTSRSAVSERENGGRARARTHTHTHARTYAIPRCTTDNNTTRSRRPVCEPYGARCVSSPVNGGRHFSRQSVRSRAPCVRNFGALGFSVPGTRAPFAVRCRRSRVVLISFTRIYVV